MLDCADPETPQRLLREAEIQIAHLRLLAARLEKADEASVRAEAGAILRSLEEAFRDYRDRLLAPSKPA